MIAQAAWLESAADFRVPLSRSRLWLALIAVCVAAVGLAWPAAAPYWPLLPLPWLAWRLGRETAGVDALEVRGGARLAIWRGGVRRDAALCDGSRVWPGMIVLQYVCAGRRERCVLLADSAPRAALRRLRVFVRWGVEAPTHQGSR
jgi:hypothetical protein